MGQMLCNQVIELVGVDPNISCHHESILCDLQYSVIALMNGYLVKIKNRGQYMNEGQIWKNTNYL